MVNILEALLTSMADGYYCITDYIFIKLYKKTEFCRVYWMNWCWLGEKKAGCGVVSVYAVMVSPEKRS